MRAEIRWCAGCTTEALFEQPPCDDGHGDDCLDLACVECGFAIVLRDLTPAEPTRQAAQAA